MKLIFFLFILFCNSAFSCSPIPINSEKEAEYYTIKDFDEAPIVAKVFVKKTTTLKEHSKEDDYDYEYQYSRMEILETYKGEIPQYIYTKENVTCCLCGTTLTEGLQYLMYLTHREKDIYVFSSGPVDFSKADKIIAINNKILSGKIDPKNISFSEYTRLPYIYEVTE